MDPNAVDVIAIDPVFKGHFGVDQYRLRIRQFNGEWTGEFSRELFRCGRAVVVILFDPHADTLVMVEQFRLAPYVRDRGAWLLEYVAGMIDGDEKPDAVAHRETMEESGCTITRLEKICDYFISPGTSDELIALYVAQVDSSKAGGIFGLANEHENIRVHVKTVDEVLALADAGALLNVNTLLGTLWFARHRAEITQRWR